MKTLTPRQQEILALIRRFITETGYPPTRSEIGEALGFRSPNAAESHLRALARKGAIHLTPGTSRGIRLTEPLPPSPGEILHGRGPEGESPQAQLPVIGRVAAGSPLLAEESIECHYAVDPALFSPRADYLLRVRGESMRDAGILDGDLLAVHRTREIRDGQIAVIRLHDEVTVKYVERRHGVVRLLPANPDFAPMELDPERDAAEPEGIGVGVIRDRLPTLLPGGRR